MIVAFKAGVGRNAEQQVQIAKTEYTVIAATKL